MFGEMCIVNKHNFATIKVTIWDYSPHSLNHMYETYCNMSDDYFILYN